MLQLRREVEGEFDKVEGEVATPVFTFAGSPRMVYCRFVAVRENVHCLVVPLVVVSIPERVQTVLSDTDL